MAKYKTDVRRWLSHESRMVEAGQEFDTEFPPAPDGKPMRLGETLHEAGDTKKASEKASSEKADKKA